MKTSNVNDRQVNYCICRFTGVEFIGYKFQSKPAESHDRFPSRFSVCIYNYVIALSQDDSFLNKVSCPGIVFVCRSRVKNIFLTVEPSQKCIFNCRAEFSFNLTHVPQDFRDKKTIIVFTTFLCFLDISIYNP